MMTKAEIVYPYNTNVPLTLYMRNVETHACGLNVIKNAAGQVERILQRMQRM